MVNWKSILNADPTEWLLEDDNPSVKYFTLVDLLNKPHSNPEVIETKNAIMEKGLVPRILKKQRKGGHWDDAKRFYNGKYKSTVWTMIILAEFGADGTNEKIKSACEFMFEWSQDRQSGGFAHKGSQQNGGNHSGVLPCLTGNMIWCLIRFGYLKDPRVKAGIDWITTYQRYDDGETPRPKGWPYDNYKSCWGKHSCHMGIAKALKAFSEIPPRNRTNAVKVTIENGVDYFLKHHIYKQSHNLKRTSKPGWKRLGFPLMWQTDILELSNILIRLGGRDERMQDAVDIVRSKQQEDGKWILENTVSNRFQIALERKGKPSKWVTLNALKLLKGYHK
jgi:hypothetical protein